MNNNSYDIVIINNEKEYTEIKKLCRCYTICLTEYKDLNINRVKQDKLFKDVYKLANFITNKKIEIGNKISDILITDFNVHGKDKLFLEKIIMSFMYDNTSNKSMYNKLNNYLRQEKSTIKKKLYKTIDNIYEEDIFNQYGVTEKPKNKEFVDKIITNICNDVGKVKG